MIKVTGKNINRFLSIIYKMKINILEVKIINRKEANIKLPLRELEKIKKIKTSHEIEDISYYGKLKVKNTIKQNRWLIISLLLGYLFLFFLSKIIFEIEVIHDNKNIRTLIIDELKEHNIVKLKLKPNYERLEEIKENILKKYKDKIEWIEIIERGTKYIVRVETREIITKVEENIPQDIIATKNAVIIKIEAERGTIVKKINDYVKKGDKIISGKITSGDKLMNIVKAEGRILGEVWYNIRVELPLIRREEKATGRKKEVYNFKLLNINIPLFDFKPFKHKKVEERNLIVHHLLPIKITKEKQYEVNVIDYIYNDSEALVKASEIATEKMKEKLDEDDEKIISKRIVKYYLEDKKIYLDMFFKVCENIGGARIISLNESE